MKRTTADMFYLQLENMFDETALQIDPNLCLNIVDLVLCLHIQQPDAAGTVLRRTCPAAVGELCAILEKRILGAERTEADRHPGPNHLA